MAGTVFHYGFSITGISFAIFLITITYICEQLFAWRFIESVRRINFHVHFPITKAWQYLSNRIFMVLGILNRKDQWKSATSLKKSYEIYVLLWLYYTYLYILQNLSVGFEAWLQPVSIFKCNRKFRQFQHFCSEILVITRVLQWVKAQNSLP